MIFMKLLLILDEIDKYIMISILNSHKKRKQITTWEMAKKYPWTQQDKGLFVTESDETAFYTAKTVLLQNRLKRLEKLGLAKIVKEPHTSSDGKISNKNTYFILGDRVKSSKHKFANKYSQALHIKNSENNKWIIMEV